MKKLLAVATLFSAGLTMTACKKETFELAMITDVGTIDDKSFNQGTWEGVEKYAKENSISHKYYKPSDKSTAEYSKTIDLAVKGGAKTIVTPGYLFENAIWLAQSKYTNVNFVLLDGTPHNVTEWNADGSPKSLLSGSTEANFDIKKNVACLLYAEHESGFLAGYVAVKAGFTNLGFIGGLEIPAVQKFGYGYVLGAQYAADKMGKAAGDIKIRYDYAGTFESGKGGTSKATAMYSAAQNPTQVIFAAAGGVGADVMGKAAELSKNVTTDSKKWVIGVDVDQSSESNTVLTSAKKELANSVVQTLGNIYNDAFSWGGTKKTFDAKVDGVGLPMDFSRFTEAGKTFNATDYTDILALLASAEANDAKTAVAKALNSQGNTISYAELETIINTLGGHVVLEKMFA